MRFRNFGLICTVLAICTLVPAPAAKPEPVPALEVPWAKGVAEDYWKALRAGKGEQAVSLMNPVLVRALADYEFIAYGNPKFDTPSSRVIPGADGPNVTVTYEAEELSPDRSEVVFRGKLGGKDWRDKAVSSTFTMRVAKEATGGKWCIRFLLIVESKEK